MQALDRDDRGQAAEAARLAQSALQELHPQNDALFAAWRPTRWEWCKSCSLKHRQAIRAFEQTAEIASQAGYGMFEITALSHLAGLRLQQGQLHAAASEYQRALELAAKKMGKRSPVTATVLLGLGEIAREWNDLEGALRLFSESLELFAQFSDWGSDRISFHRQS